MYIVKIIIYLKFNSNLITLDLECKHNVKTFIVKFHSHKQIIFIGYKFGYTYALQQPIKIKLIHCTLLLSNK